LVAGELLMQIQVRLEEAHLAALHGDDYSAYYSRVRRWL
jgi:protein-S-isoprenylcysteine O-methyltransferase Ste14